MSRRRHKKYTPRPARPPAMVALNITPELGIAQRAAIEGLRGGWADKPQFNALAECCNFLAHGAKVTSDDEAERMADFGSEALASIRARFFKVGKFGASGEELQALVVMIDYSDDWWSRQSGDAFHRAYLAMEAENAAAERAAA